MNKLFWAGDGSPEIEVHVNIQDRSEVYIYIYMLLKVRDSLIIIKEIRLGK